MSNHDTPTGNVVKGEMSYLSNRSGNPPSTIGEQIRTDHFYKRALIEIRNKQFFGQLAHSRAMPKHMGKTIKQFKYIPVLDDRNNNDQGIDAAGAAIAADKWGLMAPDGAISGTTYADQSAAVAAANTNGNGETAFLISGGLYGSSKDVGVIKAKLPALTEHGGRVNRIGFTRVVIEGTLIKRGFFSEYTQESLDFDSDAELMSHITTESLVAANEMVEDNLQLDLLSGAGVVRYCGAATNNATITAEGSTPSFLTYKALMKLSIDMDENKAPKSTKMIVGSRMIDTRVVPSARYLYCGSEMIPTIEAMEDLHGRPAFKSVETYASAGNLAVGEYGALGQWRLIIVPEMQSWNGAGAAVASNPGYRETGGHYDVTPLLFVGSGSFATIGFQTDGKTVKFKIIHKKPGYETATALDPYGEKGHYAIKWYYGFMLLRPEWIAVMKCVAEV